LAGRRLHFLSAKELSEKSTKKLFSRITAVCSYMLTKLDANTLGKFKNLKLVLTMSKGVDHIDINHCSARGIVVSNVADYCSRAVAEHAFALILAVSKNIKKSLELVGQNIFDRSQLIGIELYGKTLGVIGTGKIGKEVISIAKGFGMNVLAYDTICDISLEKSMGIKYVSLGKLLSSSDIVTIHVPLTDSTKHLLNTEAFNTIKKGAILINTSRGEIVDSVALFEALESGRLSGAGIDVLECEEFFLMPGIDISPIQDIKKRLIYALNKHLIKMDNVVVTPHNAFNTKEAKIRLLKFIVETIINFENSRKA